MVILGGKEEMESVVAKRFTSPLLQKKFSDLYPQPHFDSIFTPFFAHTDVRLRIHFPPISTFSFFPFIFYFPDRTGNFGQALKAILFLER
jgi:hypothetical protein